ncbi:hypothetical protein EWB00_001269 [Schistosoma japonicum]|uniref:Uncharacterized protein n=1 Tax=Schistosoma japonicum TaxID=6182 RepID=A0A4Z2CK56_SCHJA|nr:hypothetical protein EWB00_001269 [Schistosoma japonicum]
MVVSLSYQAPKLQLLDIEGPSAQLALIGNKELPYRPMMGRELEAGPFRFTQTIDRGKRRTEENHLMEEEGLLTS